MRQPVKRHKEGFTLMEVLVAALLFSITITALYSSYSAGLDSYRRSQRNREMQQSARAVFDLLGRELRSVYWREATSYNIQTQKIKDALGDVGFYDNEDEEDDENEMQTGPNIQGFEKIELTTYSFIKYDLSFEGKKDSVSFVRYQVDNGYSPIQRWSLARVKYFLKDKVLYRSIQDIPLTEQYDFYLDDNEEVEEFVKPEPIQEIVAKNIDSFELRYLYYREDEWLWANDWKSENSNYREPTTYEDEDDESFGNMEVLGVEMEDDEQERLYDGIPSCIEVKVAVSDRTNKKKIKKYETVIDLPIALETWYVNEDDGNINQDY